MGGYSRRSHERCRRAGNGSSRTDSHRIVHEYRRREVDLVERVFEGALE
ncbi:MAG TPA: hypothetical protein VKA37_02110 [Halobacteriales archaeon]|nr:hypothetical protein [Halobacteriales archaeon]